MSEDAKKRYVGASLSEDVYDALIRSATYQGRHPTDLVEVYIGRGLLEDAAMYVSEGNEDFPPELRVFAAYQSIRSQQTVRFQLRQIAISMLKSPSEDLADQLDALCRLCHIPYEEILQEATEASMVGSTSLSITDSDNVSNAVTFLMGVLKEGREVPANAVYQMGEAQGFSKYVLRAAKTRLGILAVRQSHVWVWIMPTQLRVPPTVRVYKDSGGPNGLG